MREEGAPCLAGPNTGIWPSRAHWGRLGYGPSLARQRALARAVETRAGADTIVIVEHPPTLTLGRHGSAADVLVDAGARAARGIALLRSDRGGQATYHGPGQVVVYPIVHIARLALGVKDWVCLLEGALLTVLASYGVTGLLRDGKPGVWTGRGKIASIGLRVVRGVSYHGVALNVGLDVSGFDCIVPCGSVGERVTSIAAECLQAPSVEQAAEALAAAIAERLRDQANKKGIALS